MGNVRHSERAEARTRVPTSPITTDVLVIDDSDLMRTSIARRLTRAGLTVVELASPIGATRTIMRKRPAVVLIDFDMPAMRGDKLISVLRQHESAGDSKLVLISGMDAEALREAAARVGADATIAKSEGPDVILSVVLRVLAEQRGE